jgi:hypothetical protein
MKNKFLVLYTNLVNSITRLFRAAKAFSNWLGFDTNSVFTTSSNTHKEEEISKYQVNRNREKRGWYD